VRPRRSLNCFSLRYIEILFYLLTYLLTGRMTVSHCAWLDTRVPHWSHATGDGDNQEQGRLQGPSKRCYWPSRQNQRSWQQGTSSCCTCDDVSFQLLSLLHNVFVNFHELLQLGRIWDDRTFRIDFWSRFYRLKAFLLLVQQRRTLQVTVKFHFPTVVE